MSGGLSNSTRAKIPKELEEVLREFVEKVKEQLSPAEVYLFGSYARGD